LLGMVCQRIFSHAQYYIRDNEFKATEDLYSLGGKKRKEPSRFTGDQIHQLFEGTKVYLKAFIGEYKTHVKPYQDGKPHQMSTGFVQWDKHQWIWFRGNSSRSVG